MLEDLKLISKCLFIKNEINTITHDVNINILSTMKLTKTFLPFFVERNKGRIFTVSSLASVSSAFTAIYGSVKQCLTTWTEFIQTEFTLLGVNVEAVVSVCGFVLTPTVEKFPKGLLEQIKPMIISIEQYAEAELDLYGTHTVSTAHFTHAMSYYITRILNSIPPSYLKMIGVDAKMLIQV